MGLDCIPFIAPVTAGHKIRTSLSVWLSAIKITKEKCLPGVLYLLASVKYNSKKVLSRDPSAFDYRKQQLNCSRNEVRLIWVLKRESMRHMLNCLLLAPEKRLGLFAF